ncbi:MAG: hypothetical protein AABZ47_08550 [Planctomycetota bacterium]
MASRREDEKAAGGERPPSHPSAGRKDGSASQNGRKPGWWWAAHGRDLRFIGLGGAYYLCFQLLTLVPFVKNQVFPGYLGANAQASAVLLRTFGEDVVNHDKTLVSNKFSVTIERGCDAVQPSALFCAAVLASPVPLLARLSAVALGTTLLMLLNFVRILSLYYTGAYFRPAFDIMHLDVWQMLFIALAVFFWIYWVSWQTRREKARIHAVAETNR